MFATHLKAKKEFESIRAAQAAQLMELIEEKQKSNPNIPIIVCGDLNDIPVSSPI